MKGIKQILDNTMVKKLLMKHLHKIMKENKVTLVTLELGEDDEFKVEAYQQEMKVLPKEDFNQILFKSLNKENKPSL